MTCWKKFDVKPKDGAWIEILAITHIGCKYDPKVSEEDYLTTHIQTERLLWRNIGIDELEESLEEEEKMIEAILYDDCNSL